MVEIKYVLYVAGSSVHVHTFYRNVHQHRHLISIGTQIGKLV